MNKRMSITLTLLLLVGSVLTACGGASAPATFSSLPVFTGATESTNEVLVAALAGGIDAGKADSNAKSVEGRVYDVPAGTTFDAIASFYKTDLEKAGWTTVSSTAPALIFSRGKQAFNATHLEALNGLIVVLTEIK